ncbi:MAG: hypothetical protein AAGI12_10210 [Pseudomonadota bacterium]
MKCTEPARNSVAGFLLSGIVLAHRSIGSVDTVNALKDRDDESLAGCAHGGRGERFD